MRQVVIFHTNTQSTDLAKVTFKYMYVGDQFTNICGYTGMNINQII